MLAVLFLACLWANLALLVIARRLVRAEWIRRGEVEVNLTQMRLNWRIRQRREIEAFAGGATITPWDGSIPKFDAMSVRWPRR